MAKVTMVKVRLHKNYEKFTGFLNGVYPVREGVCTVPNDPDTLHVLERDFGGSVVPDEPAKTEAPAK